MRLLALSSSVVGSIPGPTIVIRFSQGYRGVFWASAFVGYAVLFAYGVRGSNLSRESRMYLQTFGYVISFCEEIIAAVKLLTAYYGHSFQNRASVHESCRAPIVKNYSMHVR
jgi:hypothetical protein